MSWFPSPFPHPYYRVTGRMYLRDEPSSPTLLLPYCMVRDLYENWKIRLLIPAKWDDIDAKPTDQSTVSGKQFPQRDHGLPD